MIWPARRIVISFILPRYFALPFLFHGVHSARRRGEKWRKNLTTLEIIRSLSLCSRIDIMLLHYPLQKSISAEISPASIHWDPKDSIHSTCFTRSTKKNFYKYISDIREIKKIQLFKNICKQTNSVKSKTLGVRKNRKWSQKISI